MGAEVGGGRGNSGEPRPREAKSTRRVKRSEAARPVDLSSFVQPHPLLPQHSPNRGKDVVEDNKAQGVAAVTGQESLITYDSWVEQSQDSVVCPNYDNAFLS